MNLERLDLEKWEVLESQRNSTFADTEFQKWMSELNVSQSYEDREGIVRAEDLNRQYNFSKTADRVSILSLINPFG